VTLMGGHMETERNNVTRKRTDRTSQAWAGPRHSEGIIGNRLAALRGDPGYHRQAQRGRHEHRAAPAGKPAAASGLQGQASLIAKIEEQERWVEPTKHAALEEEIAALGISNRPMSGVRG
jgi:hypothetical protein